MRKIPYDVATEHSWIAFQEHFECRDDFNEYIDELANEKIKERFLTVGSTYLCLVKGGDWVVDIPNSDSVIDYFTESYKLVTIFSLIESLYTEQHKSFFAWLNSRERKSEFPLERKKLETLFKSYNSEYGSNKNCIKFFSSLSIRLQEQLCSSITFHGKDTTIESISNHLYNLRSQFVHRSDVVTSLGNSVLLDLDSTPFVTTRLSFKNLEIVFERGVLDHFLPECCEDN